MLHGCNCLFHASGGSPSAECASVVCTRSLETKPGSYEATLVVQCRCPAPVRESVTLSSGSSVMAMVCRICWRIDMCLTMQELVGRKVGRDDSGRLVVMYDVSPPVSEPEVSEVRADYSMGVLALQTPCPSCEEPHKKPELKPVPDETVTLPNGSKMDVYSIDVPHRQLICAKCNKPLLFTDGRLHCGCNPQSTVGG